MILGLIVDNDFRLITRFPQVTININDQQTALLRIHKEFLLATLVYCINSKTRQFGLNNYS